MHLDRYLKEALSGAGVGIDASSLERDLNVVVQRGRRRRRNRWLVGFVATVALVIGAVVLAPRALDALRSVGEPRPAAPPRPEGIPGVITTVAGTGAAASRGDGGPATAAAVHYPFDLVVDETGNLFILEASERVRKVDPAGRITTVVGPPATRADTILTEANALRLKGTNALAIDGEGNLYVGGGDGRHFMVSRISPSGQVTRVAGTGRPGFSGDGGPAIEAELGWVYDLAVDAAGNIFIVDQDNHRIRMVDTDGVITTIAGTGEPGFSGDAGTATEARLNSPYGIALDGEGNIYFTAQPGVVRRIDTSGVITTIAGSGRVGYAGDGGPATAARLSTGPEHVEVDQDGRVYIEDTGNNCIRMVDLDGTITTIVGVGKAGFRGDGGPAPSALLRQPSGMALTPDGVLYIADSGNHRVRRVIV
jgi:sugar lactone lactonase YvrE